MLSIRRLKRSAFWFYFTIVLLNATVLTAMAGTPMWSFKGAKWYSLMETGNIAVGMPTGVTMLDSSTGQPLWQRNDLGEIKEDEYTELPGTPLLLISDNSGWAQRKTKITALDTLTGQTVWQTDKMLG